MQSYNLKLTDGKLSFQPNKGFKTQIIFSAIVTGVAFILPLVWPLNYEVRMLLRCLGIVSAAYGVYDFLFKLNLTYIFDQHNRQVYQRVPGLYTRRILSFEDIYILTETVNCELHYVMSNQKNKFGRNYAISDYFPDTQKGRRKQELYETTILTTVSNFLSAALTPHI
ncbi:hypothetical protein [Chitinophaga nivalis]|uniref:DUF304 domain-containing protein n=1 Tax=Chitinophaga nivalis TaxID=2991709 RepID=A0ABT3IIX6_9BACT|nr:hypothetical protein [Chitinophaga nivalis]MCW3466412.1 hypothetical protein [Chitinophaga nivalis]MCW3483897.1 hypothetical protein [Chitinophaga nivalis]